ncbi:MAG: YncE family protein, partial [Acidobacteriota bacterium]|nr:YncE family protein [Acidobacteriota bacterium]
MTWFNHKKQPSANVPVILALCSLVSVTTPHAPAQQVPGSKDADSTWLDLPTGKQLGVVPGNPQRLNSLPMSMAVTPDSRYVVTVNAGYGTFESRYEQSLAVMDTQTGTVVDFPDDRTDLRLKQTLYSGLAFNKDGRHLYASMASLTEPVGDGKTSTGNGVIVYRFTEGRISEERLIPVPLQVLAGSRRTRLIGGSENTLGVPFPAAIALIGGAGDERMLVADNLSDNAVVLNTVTGKVEQRFDLSESDTVPGTYPIALAVSKDGTRAYVALWNASEVVELDLKRGVVGRKLALLKPADPVKPGTHPCSLQMSPDKNTLYVALANRDAVAAVDVERGAFKVQSYFDTRLPGQSYFGAEPDALAVSADGERLYVADMGSNAVAVIDTRKKSSPAAREGMIEPIGFIPTEWMPTALAMAGGTHEQLYVATAKARS